MKTYVGIRQPNGRASVMVEKNGETLRRLRHYVRHSPDGFEWGYGGSGPADLALSMLKDAINDTRHYQDFKAEVIAKLPGGPSTRQADLSTSLVGVPAGFVWKITSDQIRAWVRGVPIEPELPTE